MSTPTVKHIVRLSLLERVSPELLLRFLRPFGAYLADRGIALEDCEPNLEWVGRLHAVLTAVDPAMPGRLQQALLDVADLASDQGHEAALQVAGQRQLGLFCAPANEAPEDLAFRLYLEHGDLFTATHARVKSQEAQRFVDFFPRREVVADAVTSEAKRVLFVDQLRRWFGGRNRTEFIDVRVSEAQGEVTWLIVHGRPPRNLSVITAGATRDRLSFVPDKQDTVHFEVASGRLSVNAQFPAERDFYRQAIGRVYFGADDHFEAHPVLDCGVLLDAPEEALSPDGLDELEGVELRELTLEAVSAPFDTMTWKAENLNGVLAKDLPQLLTRGRRVTGAVLLLRVRGERRPKSIELVPPNKLKYDRRTHDGLVREYLFTKGFLRRADRALTSEEVERHGSGA